MTIGCDLLIDLLMRSPIHRKWPIEGMVRCFLPPLMLGQYRGRIENGRLVSLVTWAFLTAEAADGYRTGARKLQPEDWQAGDQLWFIDMVAPGHAIGLVRELATMFPGRIGYALRTTRTGSQVHTFVSGRVVQEKAA